MIPGIDVSTWDGDPAHLRTLDWSAYIWPFAFIKVSEGTVPDPLFARQWRAARGHVIRGAYHFFRPDVYTRASVETTLELLQSDLGELPLALDIEVTDGLSDVLERARDWLSWYEQYTGMRPIIYSRTRFLRDELKCHLYPYLANYKLWLAEYYFDKMEPAAARIQRLHDVLSGKYAIIFPEPPAPFERVSFFQWTATGTPDMIPGYYTGPDGKKEVDLNLYPGTLQEMISEFDITALPDPNQGEEPMPNYIYEITPTTSAGCKVRSDHTTAVSNQVESLPYGKKAYGNEKWTAPVTDAYHRAGDIWLQVLEVDGHVLMKPAWVAEIHQGARVARITQIATVPEEPPPTEPPAQTLPEIPVTIVLGDDVDYARQVITTTMKPK